MSWRTIVITKRAKLDLQLGFMVVRGEHTTKVLFVSRKNFPVAYDVTIGGTNR